jgi:hypothetical protein
MSNFEMSSEESERIAMFLYLADNVNSCSQLPLQMRNKINAVRSVRGVVQKNLEDKAQTAVTIYNLVAVDRTNPNLGWLKREIETTSQTLEEYKKASARNTLWLKSVDPALYSAAESQPFYPVMCACTSGQTEEDESWISTKITPKAEPDEDEPGQKFKRTRV